MAVDPVLDEQSYKDVLGAMHPDVAALMRVTANRMGTEPDRVSGHRGVWNALGVWGTRRANVVGGNSVLTDALAAALGHRVWTGAAVRRIAQTASEVAVDVDVPGRSERLTAAACIVTVPAPTVRQLMEGLPSEKDDALSHVPYGPYVVAGMFTSETEPMPWDDVYAVAVPGRSFSMLFNPANPLRTGLRRPGGSLVIYAAGDPAADLLPLGDEAITDRFLGDLHDVLPATRGLVRDVTIQRWPVGIPIAAPGRARLQPQLAARCGRVHFAGDYIGEPGLDSAAWTAEVAAQSARAMLRRGMG
jgi:oxygen-dependent protoporphyrinogen oxidase